MREVANPFAPTWRFSAFSRASVAAFGTSLGAGEQSVTLLDVARRTWDAYRAVGRQVGLTPLDSIALRAMLDASVNGQFLEMDRVHRLLLIIKRTSLLGDAVLFAAGSTLETMFVRLKPSFLERVSDVLSDLEKEWNSGAV